MSKKAYTLPTLIWAICFLSPLSSQTPTANFATWKDNKKAAYTIIHDDYSNYVTGIYQYADPIATARGIKLCFGAITSACGTLEWTKAKTMISHGHECVNHTHNHKCGGSASQCSGLATYNSANFSTELDLSTQLIETNTGVRPRFFIHPYDASSETIVNYLTGLGYLGSRSGNQLTTNANTFTDFMHLNYYVYDGTASALSSLNTAVNSAISSGGYAIREFHGIDDGSWAAMTVANYTSHLDYVKTKITDGSIWSATATDAITYKMQRDAFSPVVAYNASANTVTVSFTALKAINSTLLRTPVTLNVNVTGFTPSILSASQNGSSVTFTRVGNILSFNIYPHSGNVIINVGTPAPAPVNVTNLAATPQTNAVLLGWTNPTTAFDEVMIVAKATSGFTTVPSGTTYTADGNFTGAGTAFEGGKVVYRGTGTSMTVTGLTAGTTYFFRVFTRSGTAWSTGVQVSAIPTAPAPINITNLVATPQTNAVLLGWINPTTAFDEVMIVAKATSGFTTVPSGTTYTADANFTGAGTAFEGGKVVYRGTGTSMTVTGLTAGTTYFFRVFTRSGTAWSTGVQISAIPTAPASINITNLAATPQTNAVLLGWTNPTTAFDEVMIVAKVSGGFTTVPSGTTYTANANFTGAGTAFEGGKVVYRGTGTSMTVTGLTAGTTYFFRVFTRSGTAWSTGVQISAIPTAPAPINITNLVATPQTNAVLLGWTNPTTAFDEVLIVAKSTSGFATVPSGTTYTADANFTGAGTAFEGGKVVYRGTGTSMTVTGLTAGTTYFFRVFTRSGTAWSTGVQVSAIPTAPAPINITNLAATPQTNAVLLGWTNPTTAFDEVMIVAKATSGFTTVPSGTTYTADANFTGTGTAFEGGKVVYRGTGTSMTVTGLTAGTTYFFRVFTRSGTAWSTGVQVSAIPTAPAPINITNLVATPQTNAVLLGWTNPTTAFDEVMIVAKASAGFTTVPSGTTYTANANFTGAGTAFEGGKVVYRGTGTSMIVTGLTAGTTYFFRVFTRSGTAWSTGVQVSAIPTAVVLPNCSPDGKLVYKFWSNITLNNYDITDLTTDARYPNSPSAVDTLTQFSTFSTVSFYGDRVLGYISPQVTGNYTFAVSGADDVQFFLSTDESAVNKRIICTIPDYTNIKVFTKYPSQKSAAISLTAGKYYYVELLHIQSEGEAHFDVYWQTPTNATLSPITSAFFSSKTCTPTTPLLLASAEPPVLNENLKEHHTSYELNTDSKKDTLSNPIDLYKEEPSPKYENPPTYNIFPNPTNDYFSIDFSATESKSVEVSIISLLGKVIKTELLQTLNEPSGLKTSAVHRFEVNDLESGQYFIRIQTSGKTMVMKKLMIIR